MPSPLSQLLLAPALCFWLHWKACFAMASSSCAVRCWVRFPFPSPAFHLEAPVTYAITGSFSLFSSLRSAPFSAAASPGVHQATVRGRAKTVRDLAAAATAWTSSTSGNGKVPHQQTCLVFTLSACVLACVCECVRVRVCMSFVFPPPNVPIKNMRSFPPSNLLDLRISQGPHNFLTQFVKSSAL